MPRHDTILNDWHDGEAEAIQKSLYVNVRIGYNLQYEELFSCCVLVVRTLPFRIKMYTRFSPSFQLPLNI